MILLPQGKTRTGLLSLYNIKGITSASSTNWDPKRKDNPINMNSNDRWCSEPSGEFTPETWTVKFNHYIYITNYSFANLDAYPFPVSWTLEGYSPKLGWELLHTMQESDINEFGTFPTERAGPYNEFRFVSIQNGLDRTGYYHFCIFKVDFFGSAFKLWPYITQHKNYFIKSPFISFFLYYLNKISFPQFNTSFKFRIFLHKI